MFYPLLSLGCLLCDWLAGIARRSGKIAYLCTAVQRFSAAFAGSCENGRFGIGGMSHKHYIKLSILTHSSVPNFRFVSESEVSF